MDKRKVKNVFAWILQVVLGLEFILAGQAKFTRMDSWATMFRDWGYPDHIYLLVGGLELVGAVFVFIPKMASKAALGLAVIMIGALLTHAIHMEWDRVVVTGILAGLCGVLFWLRKASVT
ncbi:MAG: DoxX family protein [Cytophagales bacterium]|nr:DoxX family protein [Cytophagales bacterium]